MSTPNDLIHVLPSTGSDERMHVLDEGCWCDPYIEVRLIGSLYHRTTVSTARHLIHNRG